MRYIADTYLARILGAPKEIRDSVDILKRWKSNPIDFVRGFM